MPFRALSNGCWNRSLNLLFRHFHPFFLSPICHDVLYRWRLSYVQVAFVRGTDGILYRERSATFLATNGIYCCSLSHLQRFIWRNTLYPALRAGLTYCAPRFASSSCQRISFPLRFAQRTLFQRLPYGLYPCLCSIASTRLTIQISLDRTLVRAGIRCKIFKNIHSIRILSVYFFYLCIR